MTRRDPVSDGFGGLTARRGRPPDGEWLDYRDYRAGRGDPAEGVVGNVRILPDFDSPRLENRRDLLVYLPPSYENSGRRYPVLYMQDGQNLFDAATSFAGEWGVDQTLEGLSAEGIEAIVVGIPNTGEARSREYSPFSDVRLGEGIGERYVSFVVERIKPRIDADFRTTPERRCTGIVGSSLGGLISLYAYFSRPDTFGIAGVMSPALWVADREVLQYVEGAGYHPGRIYLDVGTGEGRNTVADVKRLCSLLADKGYRRREELLCITEPGAGHNEGAWRQRFRRALRFLLINGDPEVA